MQEFAFACNIDCDDGEIWLAQLRLTESVSNDVNNVAPLGKGSDNPKSSAILTIFVMC
jgi:hypothetical protein